MAKTKKQRLAVFIFALITLASGTYFKIFFDDSQARIPTSGEVETKNKVLEGITLSLNGSATHRALKVFKVYKINLYLNQKSSSATNIVDKILTPNNYAVVDMIFLRDLTAKEFNDGWRASFLDNCEYSCEGARDEFERLLKKVKGFKTGDILTIKFHPTYFNIQFNGQSYITSNKDLAKAIMLTWIGKEPPSQDFKNKLLGN